MEVTFLYIPVGTEAEAISLGNLAIELHLAACANIFPVQSVFPWNGEVQQDHEFVLILKTMPAAKMMLRSFLEKKHTYEIPCILSWEVEVNHAYGLWIQNQMNGPNPS